MLRIALYVCPQTVCSSLSMAMDAFQLANQLAGERVFQLQRFSLDGHGVDLQFARITVNGALRLAETADLVLLPATGSAVDTTLASNAALLPWLTAQVSQRYLASLCSSAFLLGAAGVLNDRAATTHWSLAPAFRQRFPLVKLQAEQLLTHDGPVFCSGGAQAGLDLCLYLIAWHAGADLAQKVAAALVVEHHRGQQTRFEPLLPQVQRNDPLQPLLNWMHKHQAEPMNLQRLAEHANCSPRTLLRRFRASTGITPNEYLQRLRISAAQAALRQPSRSLEQVAAQVGFGDRAAFAKLFKQLCGETPGAYRQRLRG
ncbi:GlxA family transcriptional regulator [Pseudomonas turukhanskensis]|uniref:Transcriptional regulator n=1 Tax=Pseudomonas turukhanskensis TaxID=1806536 RepID=A0A9W6K4Q2_9PSED|nr:helix-turn-helix domain-containing protein [Pseudomonas turukhanskensis]GLK87710.1 transcriptional regulator [Pseudomonas turukhanskensis]